MKAFIKRLVVLLLTLEARLVIKKYRPRIVAVTGSVGKTSAKDVLATALESTFVVRKSQKSYNSELGVPLTILGVESGWGNPLRWLKNILEGLLLIFLPHRYPEWLVLEVGADAPGDISTLVEWLPLSGAVLTRIGNMPVHVEFFPSVEALIREKHSLLNGLIAGGVVALNADDDTVMGADVPRYAKIITYGVKESADVRGSHYQVLTGANGRPEGITFKVTHGEVVLPVRMIGVIGIAHMYPVLAALAMGIGLGVNEVRMLEALETHASAPGRMRLLRGIKESLLIDDTYNASPVAVMSALDALAGVEWGGRKVAILGDMMELGKYSHDAHVEVGKRAAEVCDVLVTVGVRARAIHDGARTTGFSEKVMHHFESSHDTSGKITEIIHENDVVLIKGSQSPRLEHITKALLADPSDGKLLVRQEKEWMGR